MQWDAIRNNKEIRVGKFEAQIQEEKERTRQAELAH